VSIRARAYARPVSDASLLLIEDDESIGVGLVRALETEGYDVAWETTGRGALRHAQLNAPDIVLLDLGLPDMEGLEVCRRLTTASVDLPVIVLTARAEEADIVVGLDAGASDYVTKPFPLAVLLARLRVHLRSVPTQHHDTLSVGDLEVSISAHRVFADGRELALRPKEFHLLVVLMRNAGNVVRREQILDEVWDVTWDTATKTLDMHAYLLRRKLADAGIERPEIVTVRGIGYRLEP
jgi:DNA-binding response OmpR family regulator